MKPTTNMLSVKDSLLLKSGNTRSIKVCVMDFVSDRGITLTLIGRSAIQRACLYFEFICLCPFIQ